MRDLKASRMAERGDDYELREYRPGSWQLVPSTEMERTPSREERVLTALRKKPGQPSRTAPIVIAEAKAPTGSRSKKAPKSGRPNGESDHGEGSGRASELANDEPNVGEHDEAAGEQQPQPQPEPPSAPKNPYEPLPSKQGPFEVILRSQEGGFAEAGVVAFSVELSRRYKCKVHIRDGSGEIVRLIDVAAVAAMVRERGRPSKNGAPRGVGKSAAAAKLLMRPEGATFAEVVQITEWSITERFVRRLARANKCEPEKLGEKHWRLVKRKDD